MNIFIDSTVCVFSTLVSILDLLFNFQPAYPQVFPSRDPDPFEERHPTRVDPSCQLGLLLKACLIILLKSNLILSFEGLLQEGEPRLRGVQPLHEGELLHQPRP